MMSKRITFLSFVILLVSAMSLPQVEALGIGPPSFELDLRIGGTNITRVYITSDGLNGQLIVGKENLPFRIEPSRINITKEDANIPVELTFYGNETLEAGVYEGKVTFLAYTGGFVAVGIKIRAKINLLSSNVINVSIAWSLDENSTWIVTNSSVNGITISSSDGVEEEEPELETESQDYTPYLIGGTAIMVLVAIVIWRKRK